MLQRIAKFWRDHVFSMETHVHLRIDFASVPARLSKMKRNVNVARITASDDPHMADLRRLFPKQSRTFEKYLNEDVMIFVAIEDQEIMGFFLATDASFFDRRNYRIRFDFGPGESYAFNLWVDPENRRSNIASLLMLEAFDSLRTDGQAALNCMVRTAEPRLIRYYKLLGFKETRQALQFFNVLHLRFSRWTTVG